MKPPPAFCDYDCPHAEFPPADTAGICRTMSAVQCGLLKTLVNKNALCEWRRRQSDGTPESPAIDTRRKRPARRTRRN